MLKGHKASINALAFSLDDSVLVSGSSDISMRFWNVNTAHEINRVEVGAWSTVEALSFSRDGKFIAVESSSHTRIFDFDRGEWQQTLAGGHTSRVTCTDFAPSGGVVVSGSKDRTVRFWDAATGKALATIETAHWVVDVSFSSDGRVLAAALAHSAILLIDGVTRQKCRDIAISSIIRGVSMSSDGETLAVALQNNEVHLVMVSACHFADEFTCSGVPGT